MSRTTGRDEQSKKFPAFVSSFCVSVKCDSCGFAQMQNNVFLSAWMDLIQFHTTVISISSGERHNIAIEPIQIKTTLICSNNSQPSIPH